MDEKAKKYLEELAKKEKIEINKKIKNASYVATGFVILGLGYLAITENRQKNILRNELSSDLEIASQNKLALIQENQDLKLEYDALENKFGDLNSDYKTAQQNNSNLRNHLTILENRYDNDIKKFTNTVDSLLLVSDSIRENKLFLKTVIYDKSEELVYLKDSLDLLKDSLEQKKVYVQNLENDLNEHQRFVKANAVNRFWGFVRDRHYENLFIPDSVNVDLPNDRQERNKIRELNRSYRNN